MTRRINDHPSSQWTRLSTVCVFLVLLAAVAPPSSAQKGKEPIASFAKGDSVYLLVPMGFEGETVGGGFMSTTNKRDIQVRLYDGTVEVYNPERVEWKKNWRATGLPRSQSFVVSKLKTVKITDTTQKQVEMVEVTLQVDINTNLRVFYRLDQKAIGDSIFTPVTRAQAAFATSLRLASERIFQGTASALDEATRVRLLSPIALFRRSIDVDISSYKDKNYLSILLADDGSTWNTLRVSSAERIARVLSENLGLLKELGSVPVADSPLAGIRIRQLSRYGTAPYYSDVKMDLVEAYILFSDLARFAAADITSQQLIDASVVLVNGNRVQVNMNAL